MVSRPFVLFCVGVALAMFVNLGFGLGWIVGVSFAGIVLCED